MRGGEMTQQIMPLACGPDDSDDGIARAHAARRAQEEWARGLDGWADEVQAAYYADAEPPCEDVTEDMIIGEAVALPLPPWAWRRAA
jgi:hypothetical protein